MEQELLIALGANLPGPAGDPVETLRAALRDMSEIGLSLRRISRFFATPCMPKGAGPDYINACAAMTLRGETDRAKVALQKLHAVEERHARHRETRWGSRTLDLDLLAFGSEIAPDPATEAHWRDLPPKARGTLTPDRLILPHPRMAERGFVLVPLCDIAPGWRHPSLGQTVREMRAALPPQELRDITPL